MPRSSVVLLEPSLPKSPSQSFTRCHITTGTDFDVEGVGDKRFADFDLMGRVVVVTGGASGIGLALIEGLVEAGGNVYCLDRAESPGKEWGEAERRVKGEWGGALHYEKVDVSDVAELNRAIEEIAERHHRLDGLIAAAAIQQVQPALDYSPEDLMRMMSINCMGVYMSCKAAARAMFKYNCHGSICIIASMSGLIANKGLVSSVYNSSKAGLIQLARNLAMEWSSTTAEGGWIRVNCLSPGHCITPMVEANLAEQPGLREGWKGENMMHRLAKPEEFKSAGLFLISKASNFMTGNNLVIDGGHTGW